MIKIIYLYRTNMDEHPLQIAGVENISQILTHFGGWYSVVSSAQKHVPGYVEAKASNFLFCSIFILYKIRNEMK